MSADSVLGMVRPPPWSAPDSLGHTVSHRHAWTATVGRQRTGVQGERAGLADIGVRHLSFVSRMLGQTDGGQGERKASLPIVIGRRSMPTTMPAPVHAEASPSAARVVASAQASGVKASSVDALPLSLARAVADGNGDAPMRMPLPSAPDTTDAHHAHRALDAQAIRAAQATTPRAPRVEHAEPLGEVLHVAAPTAPPVRRSATQPATQVDADRHATLARVAAPASAHDASSAALVLAAQVAAAGPPLSEEADGSPREPADVAATAPAGFAGAATTAAIAPTPVTHGTPAASPLVALAASPRLSRWPVEPLLPAQSEPAGFVGAASAGAVVPPLVGAERGGHAGAASPSVDVVHRAVSAAAGTVVSAGVPPVASMLAGGARASADVQMARSTSPGAAPTAVHASLQRTFRPGPRGAASSSPAFEMGGESGMAGHPLAIPLGAPTEVAASPHNLVHATGRLGPGTADIAADRAPAAGSPSSAQAPVASPVATASTVASGVGPAESVHVARRLAVDEPGARTSGALQRQRPAQPQPHGPSRPQQGPQNQPVDAGASGLHSAPALVVASMLADSVAGAAVAGMSELPHVQPRIDRANAARVGGAANAVESSAVDRSAGTGETGTPDVRAATAIPATVAAPDRVVGDRQVALSHAPSAQTPTSSAPQTAFIDVVAPRATVPPAQPQVLRPASASSAFALSSPASPSSQGPRSGQSAPSAQTGSVWPTPPTIARATQGVALAATPALSIAQPSRMSAAVHAGAPASVEEAVLASTTVALSGAQPQLVDGANLLQRHMRSPSPAPATGRTPDAPLLVEWHETMRHADPPPLPIARVRTVPAQGEASASAGIAARAASSTALSHVTPAVAPRRAQAASGPPIDRAPAPPAIPSLAQQYGVMPTPGEATSELHATAAPQAAAAAAQAGPAIDLDDIVERAVQALMLKLDIERERRGFARWA